jgi:hypothetical protein
MRAGAWLDSGRARQARGSGRYANTHQDDCSKTRLPCRRADGLPYPWILPYLRPGCHPAHTAVPQWRWCDPRRMPEERRGRNRCASTGAPEVGQFAHLGESWGECGGGEGQHRPSVCPELGQWSEAPGAQGQAALRGQPSGTLHPQHAMLLLCAHCSSTTVESQRLSQYEHVQMALRQQC